MESSCEPPLRPQVVLPALGGTSASPLPVYVVAVTLAFAVLLKPLLVVVKLSATLSATPYVVPATVEYSARPHVSLVAVCEGAMQVAPEWPTTAPPTVFEKAVCTVIVVDG